MARPAEKTTLYALIAAGAAAHATASAALTVRGLRPGADAVIFALSGGDAVSETDLAAFLGLGPPRLRGHLDRIVARGLVELIATGPELGPHARLTETGRDTAAILERHWDNADRNLRRALGKKSAKRLRKMLAKAATSLRR